MYLRLKLFQMYGKFARLDQAFEMTGALSYACEIYDKESN